MINDNLLERREWGGGVDVRKYLSFLCVRVIISNLFSELTHLMNWLMHVDVVVRRHWLQVQMLLISSLRLRTTLRIQVERRRSARMKGLFVIRLKVRKTQLSSNFFLNRCKIMCLYLR
jgi:hypothetical protein